MIRVGRAIAAVVVALAVALALIVAVELFGAIAHPFPPDFGGTPDEMCKHVERFPAWVLAVVVPLWAGTAFIGTWLGGRIGNRGCALGVGLLLLGALIFNLSMLPYPIWFKIACVLAVGAAGVRGILVSSPRRAVTMDMAI